MNIAEPEPTEYRLIDLQRRWKVSSKTAKRHILRINLKPCRTAGARPIFALKDVVEAEARGKAMVEQALGFEDESPKKSVRIITIREARAIAGRKKRAV